MTFEINYRWDGDQAIDDFGYMLQEIERPARLLQAWKSYRTSQFNLQFSAGTDPYGDAVQPLSAMYARYKAKRYGARPIRVASGETRGSYKCEISGNTVVETVGGNARWLQGDGRVTRLILPNGDIPAKDQQKLTELALKFLEQTVRN